MAKNHIHNFKYTYQWINQCNVKLILSFMEQKNIFKNFTVSLWNVDSLPSLTAVNMQKVAKI